MGDEITVEKVNIDRWINSIERFPISPFLTANFIEVLRSKRLTPIYLLFLRDGKIIGGVSGIVDNSDNPINRILKFFKSIIFYSSPYIIEGNDYNLITEKLIQYIIKNKYRKFLIMGYDLSKKLITSRTGYRFQRNESFIVHLNYEWDEVMKGMSRGIKRKLKKVEQWNLTYHISNNPNDIDTLYDLMENTAISREKRGYHNFLKDYIPHIDKKIIKILTEKKVCTISYVKKDERVLSMKLFISTKFRAYAMFIGTNEEGYKLESNVYNYIMCMKYLHNKGMILYHLGGLPKEGKEGLIQFKKGLGAEELESWTLISPILLTGFRSLLYKYMTG